ATAKVVFGEPLTKGNGPINCELHTWIYGGFAVDKREQKLRGIKHVDGMEWVSYTVEHDVGELEISVQSKRLNFTSRRAGMAIYDIGSCRQPELEVAARSGFQVDAHRIRCRIRKPRIGYSYEIRWEVPDGPRRSGVDAAHEFRRLLIRAA